MFPLSIALNDWKEVSTVILMFPKYRLWEVFCTTRSLPNASSDKSWEKLANRRLTQVGYEFFSDVLHKKMQGNGF